METPGLKCRQGTYFLLAECRLCLENLGTKNIFETRELQQDILACTGVKISSTDGLPQKVCMKCSDTIINAKELKLLAAKNDRYLKLLLEVEDDEDDGYPRDLVIVEFDESSSPKRQEPNVTTESQENTDYKDNEEDPERKTIQVRKDLFGTSSMDGSKSKHSKSQKKKSIIKVQSKEDYDKIKKESINDDPNSKVVYECEMCCKSFDTYKKLYLHTRLHNKKIVCPLDVCGKKFATNGDLEKHLRTHTGVKPYTCDICDRSFTQQGSLKSHRENVHYSIEKVKLRKISSRASSSE